MDLLAALVALLVGTAAGFALARARTSGVAGERDALRAERDRLRVERDDARAEREAVATQLSSAQAAAAAATERLAAEREAAAERITLLERNEWALKESFQALAAQAMESNSKQFLEMARDTLKAATTEAKGDLDQRKQAVEHLVAPIRETLGKVEVQLRQIEGERQRTFATLAEQMRQVGESSERLRTETATLVTALRKPQARGRWGEMQLRRVVEFAGMVNHCDFNEQTHSADADGAVRPDLVVHLSGDKHVVVDAKVPLDAFLELAEAADEAAQREAAARHARHLRTHVEMLAKKSYGTRVSGAPEFVVMFVPNEALLSAAFDCTPDLLEFAAERSVIIATPTTLIAMLKAIAFGWRQEALAHDAREIAALGHELFERLSTMGGHFASLGRSLKSTVESYNKTVGSLETRVFVSARKLADYRVATDSLDRPPQVDVTPRQLERAELVESAAASRDVVPLAPNAEPPVELDDELRRAAGLA